jgi:nucleotide-binding universal stress UspA family protein
VKIGAPAREIASVAAKSRTDLIVMGRGGGRALRDAFLGSTAERVVRAARVPVLVVRRAPRAAYTRPALALDFDHAAHEAIRLMLRVLPPPRPRVEVIHAYDLPYATMAYPSLADLEADQHLRLKAGRRLTKLLESAWVELGVPHEEAPAFKTHVRFGSPRAIVEKAIKKLDSDLLVIGTRGYSGPAYLILGTIAGELLREAACDVLVVPPRA